MYISEQQQNLRKISECCICRKEVNSNEKTIVCPDCQTIYHHKHLSLWLKIRKKCPICKNLIKHRLLQYYTNVKDNSPLYSFTISPISQYRKQKKKVNFHQIYPEEDFYLFECSHCGNIMNIHGGNSSIQCTACGSSLSINLHINLSKGYLRYTKMQDGSNRGKRSIKIQGNRGKISSRRLKLQKKEKRDIYRKKLLEQSQIELQQQIALSFNQEYLKRQNKERGRHQTISLKYFNTKNEGIERDSKKKNLSCFIPRVLKLLIKKQ